MPRIIISWIAIVWITLSTLSTCVILASLLNSAWLLRIDSAESRRLSVCPRTSLQSELQTSPSNHLRQPPSIGPWTRCQVSCVSPQTDWSSTVSGNEVAMYEERCQLALWGFGERPAPANKVMWATGGLFLIGNIFLIISQLFVTLSLCKREICERSLLSFTGSVQGLADLILFTGLIVWPIGWDSVTVREVCGGNVGPYSKGNCTFGWAPLCAGCGFLLLFVCALLAIAVDKSITTHEATRKMLLEGKNFVFLH
ncbi:Lipoma hmgic fusion partner protein [Paragonimus heterotremus]|uniref:Lipoma hmgic fusion partner protein n=1 Tax=Paragonimus heterotremus TaxID=100268 RepID=A0A8J4WJF6_9TREM|nr:Lipoma hmgic fusion partner protein [Paragonimus heterotremus]